MRWLPALLVLSACSAPLPPWEGTVVRDGGPELPWVGFTQFDDPDWNGDLTDRLLMAGGYIDSARGPLFAQAVVFVDDAALGTQVAEPLQVGDEVPIVSRGSLPELPAYWAHLSWIEQDTDGEIVMRHAYDNSGGEVNGTLHLDALIQDPDTDAYGFVGRVEASIRMAPDDGEHPGDRDVAFTMYWGVPPPG